MVTSLAPATKWLEVPVALETFVSDPFYLGHPPLSDIQLDAVRASAEIFDIRTVAEDPSIVIIPHGQCTEVFLEWGMGGGKDLISNIIHARLMYLLGCLVAPLGLLTRFRSETPPERGIDLLNIAISATQAERFFFDPFKRMLRNSEWFMDILQVMIMDRVIHCPPIMGSDPKEGDMYAINSWSGHSGQEALMGGNLLCAVLDEIDGFRDIKLNVGQQSRRSVTASSIWSALHLTVQSRFPGIGKTIGLSWPRYKGSFIDRKVEEGRGDPTIYTSGPHATWDVNPTKRKEDFADEFRKNPEEAQAKYEARPMGTHEGYFSNSLAVLRCFHAARTEAFSIERDEKNPGPEPPVNWKTMMVLPGLPDAGALYCWHVDLALTGTRAAVAMSHHAGYIEDEVGTQLPVIQLDMVYWWEGAPGEEIQLADVTRFILEFALAGYRTATVTFDGFQSSYSKQQFNRHDQYGNPLSYGMDGKPKGTPINSEALSVDKNTRAYDTLKETVYAPGRLRAFFCPLAVEELLGLVKIGNKVEHQADGSKDLADAIAGSVFNSVNTPSHVSGHRKMRRGSMVVGAAPDYREKGLTPSGIVKEDGKVRARRPRFRAFGR